MALAHRPPNTIYLGGEITKLNEWIAGVAITPGMNIERYNEGGKMKWRPHSGAAERPTRFFALEKMHFNKGVDDVYAINELVYAAEFHPGSTVWGLVPSGQDISAGDNMQSNGDGMMKQSTATTAAANVANFVSNENLGVIAATTRCVIEVH